VQEVIPTDDEGVRVTDRGRRDDARAFEGVDQQKCRAHLLRSIDDGLATKQGRARDFGEPLKGLLQEALALWHAHRDGHIPDVQADADALQAEVTSQWRDCCLKEAAKQRLLTHSAGTTTAASCSAFGRTRESPRRTIGRSGHCAWRSSRARSRRARSTHVAPQPSPRSRV
jgi:hypothetical protein